MKKSVLVVDDEAEILSLMDDFLSSEGYTVLTCSSSSKALEVLKENMIPVIITDLNMPAMDGVAFCRELRKTNPISAVIALTGYHKLFEVSSCRSAGFDDYLRKPVDLELILEVVNHSYAKVCRWVGAVKS